MPLPPVSLLLGKKEQIALHLSSPCWETPRTSLWRSLPGLPNIGSAFAMGGDRPAELRPTNDSTPSRLPGARTAPRSLSVPTRTNEGHRVLGGLGGLGTGRPAPVR